MHLGHRTARMYMPASVSRVNTRLASNFVTIKILSNDGDEIALNQYPAFKVGLEGVARGS
jgi:hypothetical protein